MPEKTLRLDLPVLLPDVPDARDACVARLTDELAATPGVEKAHVLPAENGQPARVCIHYDPARLALPRIRRTAERAGARITGRYGHVVWPVEGLGHQRRARTVARRVQQIAGVVEAEANAAGPIRIEFDRRATDEGALQKALEGMGVQVTGDFSAPPGAAHDHDHDHGGEAGHAPAGKHDHAEGGAGHAHGGVFGEKTELAFALLAGVCVALGWVLRDFAAVPPWLPTAFFLGGYAFGGFFTIREAWDSVRAGRFEIDFLMIVAAVGAAFLGAWLEGALLLFLFSLGHALEHYAMGRARRAIEALGELAPETALVRRDGREMEVPVASLQVGETVVVKTNTRVPADGFVVKGSGAVNQAPITGESVPVDKTPVDSVEKALASPETLDAAHRVFAGTINGSGALEIVVTKVASESTLARVVQMVAEAETERSPTQRFTDRFERVFVPAVLGLVVLLLFAWLVVDEPFAASFYRAMAVLVAASPCALAIATPSAVLSGVARAGRGGVLVKGGGPLENLGTLRAIAFDKTGTLTEGRPRVTDVLPAPGASADELLAAAVAVEKLSDHPLARAVVQHGEAQNVAVSEQATGIESITGRGVRAQLGGEAVFVGKADLFDGIDGPPLPDALRQQVEALERDGRTTMVVRRGRRYLGALGLMDTPRAAARDTLAQLRRLGITRMVMISGDNQQVADAVARAVGLDEARGDLMPDDKVETIRQLGREAPVAMVGDGVNDAPAMAHATVGIAMGAAGSDVALETADVALMSDDLRHLPFAVGLSRKTRGIIRQNLWLSLGMVAFLVPATVFGLGIGPAVALHEGSTLVVVFNALRLLAYRAPTA